MADPLLNYLFHFGFVFGCMVLFFVPFVTVFYIQQRAQIRAKKPHFNQFMELFFQSRSANLLVFFWAAGEATFWFIIPEFLLFLVIFMRVQRKRHLLYYDIAGTTVGTIVGLLFVWPKQALLSVPYIFEGMIDKVQTWYQDMGIWGLLNQPFSGVPYKVFIADAHNYALPLILFVVFAVLIRLFRYGLAYYILLAIYPAVRPLVRKHYSILFVLGIAVFTLMLMHVSDIYR